MQPEDLQKIEVGESIRIVGRNNQVISIERVILGHYLGWHLHHGKTRVITKDIRKILRYINDYSSSYGEIVDFGEF